jgi:hypothetical protein
MMTKLSIFTWGRCQRGYAEILHPKRIDLSSVTTRRGEHEIEIPGICRIKYENRDSSKNLHREVEIVDIYIPVVVVRNWGALSCSRGFDNVYKVFKDSEGIKYEELEVKEELTEVEDGKFRVTVKRTYVEVNGEKVYISENEVGREVCVEKLTVRVFQKDGKTYVNGETYHIREKLKERKFRWDPERKAWYKDADVNKVVEELKALGVGVVGVED